MRLLRLVIILAVGLATLSAATAALADEPGGVTLKPIPPGEKAPGQDSVVLSAQLTSDDSPIAGMPVTFYVVTTVFGERLMKVGEALSDATGTASVLYRPTWDGDITAVARFGGSANYPATQASFHFQATDTVSPWEPPKFGLEPIRQWLPFAVGLAVLAVLGSLGYALGTTVLGIPAAAGRAPATQPLPPWDSRVRRPMPVGRALLGMAVLLAVAAVPAAMLIGRARAPDDVTLSTQSIHYEHDGMPVGGVSPGAQPAPLPETEPLAATLVRSVQTTVFDASGQPAAGSVSMPADVAITAGRIRILDANKGRVITVTPDGTLATILDAAQYGDLSLHGAEAMTALGERLFIAASDGTIIVVKSSGAVEGVIRPVVPAGQAPLTPGGIAVSETGEIWISDTANHRVILMNDSGEFEQVIGSGAPADGDAEFNAPGGITFDDDGNIYVVDTGNHVVKKFSPMGVFLERIGEGRLGQPSSVAVDSDGRVFVSDESAAVVSAFGPDGTYLGSIGQGQLQAPHGVKIEKGLVYVMDRLAGLFVYEAQPPAAASRQ